MTTENEAVDARMDYNHAGDLAAAKARTIRHDIRKRSTNSRDTPKFVVAECLTQISRPSLSQLPSVDNLKRAVRSARKTDQPRVEDPET